MMRIKDAISRRRLIQQLNDDYAAQVIADNDDSGTLKDQQLLGPNGMPGNGTGESPRQGEHFGRHDSTVDTGLTDHHRAYLQLQEFVQQLNTKLSDSHRRALRVTWKRLSEAPKTSGRGNLLIMSKVFDKLVAQQPDVMSVFYRSAFLKCIDDRVRGVQSGTIATLRDHAFLLIDLIDGIMAVMFESPLLRPVWDPATIGRAHARLVPMGFERSVWNKLGECFAEVMFSQECVRAYPHAASAWSTLAVAITDKMYSHSRIARSTDPAWRNSRLVLNNSLMDKSAPIKSSSSPKNPRKKSSSASGMRSRKQSPSLKAKPSTCTPTAQPGPSKSVSKEDSKECHLLPKRSTVSHGGCDTNSLQKLSTVSSARAHAQPEMLCPAMAMGCQPQRYHCVQIGPNPNPASSTMKTQL